MTATKPNIKALTAEYRELYIQNMKDGVYNPAIAGRLKQIKAIIQCEEEYKALRLR